MSPPTVTVYCRSCEELQDVAYEGWVEGKLAVPLCGYHAEHSVRLWRKHHLCPRCLCGAMRPPDASTGLEELLRVWSAGLRRGRLFEAGRAAPAQAGTPTDRERGFVGRASVGCRKHLPCLHGVISQPCVSVKSMPVEHNSLPLMKFKITLNAIGPPQVVAMVTFESGVIRCSNAKLMAHFERGIPAASPELRLVTPAEPELFWKSIPYFFIDSGAHAELVEA